MKNKYISCFINSFAAIGFFVVACSVADSSPDDSPDDNAPIVQSNIGKYQISQSGQDPTDTMMSVINTESGVLKTFYFNHNDNVWVERAQTTFSH